MASVPQILPPRATDATPGAGQLGSVRHAVPSGARRAVPAGARRDRRSGLTGRYAARLALCVPYLALAAVAIAHRARPPADVAIETQAHAHGSSAPWFAHAVPMLPVLIARVLPGGAATLVVASALCAGGILQLVVARLMRAGLDRWLLAIGVLAIAGMPLFWASIGTSIATAASLACLSVAFVGGVDFVISRRTSGGYAAGISLAGAVLCDPGTLACVVALVAATHSVTVVRRRAEPHVSRSLSAILLFPTVALLSGWAFFDWRLAGAGAVPLAVVGLAHGVHPALGGLLGAARTTGLALLCSPVFALSGIMTARRRPITGLGFAAVPVALVLEGAIGLVLPLGATALVLALFGILVLAPAPGRRISMLVCAALVAGAVSSTLLVTQIHPALHALGL